MVIELLFLIYRFGKSDKFAIRYNYTYEGFVDWMSQFVEGLDLKILHFSVKIGVG